jgi:formylglycine-generating enzyme required for sulfatase activity
MAAILCALSASAIAEVEMKSESWENTQPAFEKFDQRIRSMSPRNLLARRGVRVAADSSGSVDSLAFLTDGCAGERCEEGRVFVNGQPSIITFYLGAAKTIKEVGVFTFNGDARANQDFEVRFADNSKEPGKLPTFPEKPGLTTGDKILGKNGGGFHTFFVGKGGGALAPTKVDWVEFRIWRTYNVQAGQPAKTKTPGGGSTVIELEVLGEENDAIVPSAEGLARREAIRKAPKAPAIEKKAAWQETMLAAREAILAWECLHDRLALPDSGVAFGPWRAIGPFPSSSKGAAEIERLRAIDPARQHVLREGQAIAWRELPDLEDGETLDVAKTLNAKPSEVIFLVRPLTVDRLLDHRNPFAIGVGMGTSTLKLLPSGAALADPRPGGAAVPNQRTWNLTVAQGQYQVLAKLTVAPDGTCGFWFMPQPSTARPGAGTIHTRISRRETLYDQMKKLFPDPVSLAQVTWEQTDSIWIYFERRAMAGIERFPTDWAPGDPAVLNGQYQGAIQQRLKRLADGLTVAQAPLRAKVQPWLAAFEAVQPPGDLAAIRKRYYALATVQEVVAEAHRIESMRLAIEDQRDTFRERYPKAQEYLTRVAELDSRIAAALPQALDAKDGALAAILAVREDADRASKEILLANPLLGFDKLLLASGGPGFNSNWSGPNSLGSELVVLSPVRPDGKLTTIYRLPGGSISNFDLSFDAKKILFSNGRHIFEINSDGTGARQISQQADEHVFHYDPCYPPDGAIMFTSTACEQAVPCTGQWYVGNLHRMDPDGRNERRITFDQDHSWNPAVLNNGRVIYTRWEYTDTPHYFSRLLFHMNPDGTEQMEYYGSNSYWPNAMYWPLPIPGHPTMISCVVSGHHGVARIGELLILDPAKGRQEADGVVQRIPGRGRKVAPIIEDGLVQDSWPKFAAPSPLAEPGTDLGAGKYFLATVKLTPWSPWGIYLVDVFDNMTPILMGGYSMPTPFRPRYTTPVIPPKVDLARTDATVYITNLYAGGSLKDYPRGSIKALRVGTHHYRYGNNGDTYACSHDGGWDIKRILGTAPVYEDGSAYFRVPANTPIFVQPLDVEGKAQQVMRSWFTAMPGEVVSCVGCHERQNFVPPNSFPAATKRPPSDLQPWHGPARGSSFEREVQPVLNRRCVGCHSGQARQDAKQPPDFRDKRLHANYNGHYSPAYINLVRYVRRPGYEADYHLPAPAEWEATTSHLIQLLKKGHNNVKLTPEEWERLYAWIDFNVNYPLNWRESHVKPEDSQVERRAKYKKLYANVDDRDENPLPLPEIPKFEPPEPEPPRPAPVKLDGWPLKPEAAARLQQDLKLPTLTLDLGSGVTIALVPIPAGKFVMGDANGFPDEFPEAAVSVDKPFYIGQLEVTNEQYAQFDPAHDSGYMDARGKDRFTRGYPVNEPRQPVIRVTWHRAMAFCGWLSRRTGQRCTLPTEAQWEWACRAGTATPWSFGEKTPNLNSVGNFADSTIAGWNWGRSEPGYSDGAQFSIPGGRYKPNSWGLCDLHGNVAEWTLSAYAPYPYNPADGRDMPEEKRHPLSFSQKVVRGGSWNDLIKSGRSASRWAYLPHQPVYNVGFRVVLLPDSKVASR